MKRICCSKYYYGYKYPYYSIPVSDSKSVPTSINVPPIASSIDSFNESFRPTTDQSSTVLLYDIPSIISLHQTSHTPYNISLINLATKTSSKIDLGNGFRDTKITLSKNKTS